MSWIVLECLTPSRCVYENMRGNGDAHVTCAHCDWVMGRRYKVLGACFEKALCRVGALRPTSWVLDPFLTGVRVGWQNAWDNAWE